MDTLHLTVEEAELEDHFSMDVTPATFNSATGEPNGDFPLYQVDGKQFSGREAFANFDNFSLQFFPYVHKPTGKPSVSKRILMTVPKVVGVDNYYPATGEQLKQAVALVEAQLKEYGFQFDINKALIRRFDCARTFVAANTFGTYLPVLSVLKPTGMETTLYDTSLLWKNSQWELNIYHKTAEMAERQRSRSKKAKTQGGEGQGGEAQGAVTKSEEAKAENAIRVELRWIETKSFKSATKMTTVADVLSDFGHVQNAYRKQLEKRVFRLNPDSFDLDSHDPLTVDQVLNEIRMFPESSSWLERWIRLDWSRSQSAERIKIVQEAIKQVTKERKLASQNVSKKVHRIFYDYIAYGQLQPQNEPLSTAKLYTELREAILAE